ncbi:MAG: ribosome maturation factor RimP [Rhodocyclaceae bacterium]|nr:MAG: ribosome maturation factor RimP [Rhodocyclaceae bacterium]
MQIAELIEQAVTGLGYELVDFETSPRARLMRVFIDRPAGFVAPVPAEGEAAAGPAQGGITVEDCANVSNHLTRLFTVENIDYDRLEVSSPGMDRPLKKAADFERFAGKEAQLKLRIPVCNQRNFSGVLGGLKEGSVVLVAEGVEHAFPLDNVEKARLIPKF